jgi:hypothetical protein
MATLQLTQVYLEPAQKKALGQKAKARGVKVSEVIRDAVDTYLAGVTSEELLLLDRATARAAEDFAAMGKQLDETNEKLDKTFAKIAVLRNRAAA